MFCHFWQKFENSKWPPFLGRGKFFAKIAKPCGSKITKVKEIEANLCFAIFGKNSKIQNGRHGVENFDEIALSGTVKDFVFCQKIRKFKMAAILGRGKFFENCKD